MGQRTKTRSTEVAKAWAAIHQADGLGELQISPEVAWYMESRGHFPPKSPPQVKTPEPTGKGAVFDPAAVDKVLSAMHRLRHTQGEWYGRPLDPDPWQIAYVIAPVFGWKQPGATGELIRCFRKVFVEVPRKNGKTTLAGGIMLYLAFADGEMGAQVVCAASGEKQARFAFDPLRKLAKEAPSLRDRSRVFKHRIIHLRSSSYIEVVSAAAEAQHGANLHGALIDELHVHKTPDLVEAIETGTGARRQPIVLTITTADDSRSTTIYDRRHSYIEKIASGTINDPAQYGVIWHADETDDPFDESTWAKANPGYPIAPTRAYMESAAAEARQSPAELAKFLRLNLNIRTKQDTRYFEIGEWDNAAGVGISWEDAEGRIAYGGVDLANTSDLTACAWVLPDLQRGGFDVIWRFWLPEESIGDLNKRTHGAAEVWASQGFLTVTPGNVTDYEYVKQQIMEDALHFDVAEIAIDKWNATHVATRLVDEGLPVHLKSQSTPAMNDATKELARLLRASTPDAPLIRHGGHPVARWCADNFAVQMDTEGNVRPAKGRAADKIDGVVALIMALDRAMIASPGSGPSVMVV